MAKWWREPLDPSKHRDHFPPGCGWNAYRPAPADRLVPRWAYFLRVCGFTFEFVSLDQLRECLEFYRTPILPSSREEVFEPEKGMWQKWHERLPLYLREEPKRVRVVKALTSALSEFSAKSA